MLGSSPSGVDAPSSNGQCSSFHLALSNFFRCSYASSIALAIFSIFYVTLAGQVNPSLHFCSVVVQNLTATDIRTSLAVLRAFICGGSSGKSSGGVVERSYRRNALLRKEQPAFANRLIIHTNGIPRTPNEKLHCVLDILRTQASLIHTQHLPMFVAEADVSGSSANIKYTMFLCRS